MAASMHTDNAGCSAGEPDQKKRIVGVLRSSRLLGRLPAEDLCRLAGQASITRQGNGAVVFRQGHAADALFIVAGGHVGIFLGQPGDYACLGSTVAAGDLLGEAGIIGAATYPTSAQMLSAGELVSVSTVAMRQLMSERFETVLALMSEMSGRIRRQVREIMDLKMKTAPQRLAGHLAMLTQVEEGAAEVRLPYEKKLLASQLGMQPETLSRALMKLQALGVSNGNNSAAFRLRDVGRLRQYASEDLEPE